VIELSSKLRQMLMGVLSKLKLIFGNGKKRSLPVVDVEKRFDLMGRTGQGSMSKVYRARDRKLGRVICLKILDKEKTRRFEARFIGRNRPTEGAICMNLRHKNIVHTYEHGMTTKGEPYIVFELIEGVGLNYLIDTKSPQLATHRIDYLLQATEGLEYMHQRGFLHRDICPRNIMVDGEGVVKLIDFGLSIPYRPEFCRPGNRTGTSSYLAPELIKRVGTDHRVDLFALGVTAYEVFTGNLPWEKAQSLQTVLAHLNSPGRNPREFAPDLNEPTTQFLIKAIERTPQCRFQTATEFHEALKALPYRA
jgi:serine/threonine protein kinase